MTYIAHAFEELILHHDGRISFEIGLDLYRQFITIRLERKAKPIDFTI